MKKFNKTLSLFLCLPHFLLMSCSLGNKVNWSFPSGEYDLSDYRIVNKSKDKRPEWIKKYKTGGLVKKNEIFYSFETGPKFSKEISCNLIKAYARDQISEGIVNLLIKGENESSSWVSFVRENLLLDFQEGLKSAEIIDDYWENRIYFEKTSSGQDIEAFSCAMLIKISKVIITEIIGHGRAKLLLNYPDRPELLEKSQSWKNLYLGSLKK